MSRLEITAPDKAQLVIEGLYKDLERRIESSPPGLCPVDMTRAFLEMCHTHTCGKCVPCRIGLAQSKTGKGKGISLGVIVAAIAFLFYKYSNLEGAVDVEAPIFQQFNPCYVVALTPVSVALFSWLHKIGKEPTSPEKIGLGMLVAALGFVWMAVGSMGLELPLTQGDPATEGTRVSANLLIYPDENHWVLKPQNGVLWQRTFFGWLDKWLKK